LTDLQPEVGKHSSEPGIEDHAVGRPLDPHCGLVRAVERRTTLIRHSGVEGLVDEEGGRLEDHECRLGRRLIL
jgi:hypothetical protein